MQEYTTFSLLYRLPAIRKMKITTLTIVVLHLHKTRKEILKIMTKSKENNRIEKKASRTAFNATFYRFLMTKDKRIEVGGTDNLAYLFMPSIARFFLGFSFFRNLITKNLHKRFPGTYEYVIARTRFFDEIFVRTAKEKTPQIVILGAGYDTRAIRFQNFTKDTVIYELDAPLTLNEKKKYFERNKIQLPENIVYVPINFNNDDLKQTLLKNGYDPKKKTMFVWEGVTMYLNPQAVKETLSFIKNNSGIGSTIVFDYFYDSVIKRTCDSIGAKELSDAAMELGEQFNFGVEEGKIIEFLNENGFLLIKHYTPNEFEEKYLRTDDGNIIGSMYGFAGNVIAKLKDDLEVK